MKLVPDRDYFVCEYCTSFAFPNASDESVRVLGESTPIDCPICQTRLALAAVEKSRVRSCTHCKGMLISQFDFYDVLQRRRAKFAGRSVVQARWNPDELGRKIKCPLCQAEMDVHLYGGGGNAVIDTCAHCGIIWLDYGELTQMASAPDYGTDHLRWGKEK